MPDLTLAESRRCRPGRSAILAVLLVVIIGVAVNVVAGTPLDQAKLLYPIDRLRLSMAIALPGLRDAPISGYVPTTPLIVTCRKTFSLAITLKWRSGSS